VERTRKVKSSTLLIALCWLVYACSYIGKLSYNANISQIEDAFGVLHKTAGAVGTYFFFAYGIGQIVNGLFCKHYNLRWVVFFALVISSATNIAVACTDNFSFVKYLWLVNGGALSMLWPSLMRFLSETLDKKDMPKTVVVMGTTVATGTVIVYGISALFSVFDLFRVVFWVAGLLLPCLALLWATALPKLREGCKQEYAFEETEENAVEAKQGEKGKLGVYVVLSLCVLAVFAVVDNFTKDGLTTWVPSILKETYGYPTYLSILLTLILPIFAIFGTAFAVRLHKKMSDFVLLCAVFFLVSSGLIGCALAFMELSSVILLLCFAFVSCFMSSINNVITSMAPLYFKEKVNSGMLAGLLNGCCYIGSTLSAYGLGSVADGMGWSAVFWLLLALTAGVSILGVFAVGVARVFVKRKGAGMR